MLTACTKLHNFQSVISQSTKFQSVISRLVNKNVARPRPRPRPEGVRSRPRPRPKSCYKTETNK